MVAHVPYMGGGGGGVTERERRERTAEADNAGRRRPTPNRRENFSRNKVLTKDAKDDGDLGSE